MSNPFRISEGTEIIPKYSVAFIQFLSLNIAIRSKKGNDLFSRHLFLARYLPVILTFEATQSSLITKPLNKIYINYVILIKIYNNIIITFEHCKNCVTFSNPEWFHIKIVIKTEDSVIRQNTA